MRLSNLDFFLKVRELFYRAAFVRCATVAQDQAQPAGSVSFGPSSLALYGHADSAQNLMSVEILPLVSGTMKVHTYHGETSPVGSYANAPIGSLFKQYTISSGAISACKWWLKTTSTLWTPIGETDSAVMGGVLYGTAGTGFTATEYGQGLVHRTKLVAATNLGAIAGGAALALGKLAYTFPAGVIVVKAATMNIALDEDDGNITTDTPDVGIGTTIGSGVEATLDGVGAAAENILTGQTAADCNGTATTAAVNTALYIASGGDHTVYLNVADDWAASGEDNCAVSGTITLEWEQIV